MTPTASLLALRRTIPTALLHTLCALLLATGPTQGAAAADSLSSINLGGGTSACDPSKQSCTGGNGAGGGGLTCAPSVSGAPCDSSGPASLGGTTGGVNMGAGNPINVATGNKYQREVDLPALPGVLGLEIVRHYNSTLSGPDTPNGILGRGWRLSYDTELFVVGRSVQILQADGSRILFSRDPADPSQCAGTDPGNGRVLIHKRADGETFTWVWPDGRHLDFDARGRLVQISAPTGEFVTLQRDPRGFLVKVTDPQGRSLRLSYLDNAAARAGERFRGVTAIDSPVGRFAYEYGSTPPAGTQAEPRHVHANLVKVSLPTHLDTTQPAHAYTERGITSSAITRSYHYEDPRHPTLLTGISVVGTGSDGILMNARIATYAYDDDGRAVLSVRGTPAAANAPGSGIEQINLEYGSGQTTLTNSLGQRTTYAHALVAGEFRLVEVRGAGCASCGPVNVRYDYDTRGRLAATTTLARDGTPLTTMRTTFDALGRPLRRTRSDWSGGRRGPERLLARYEYAGADAPASRPALIARPSVVPGREHRIVVRYNAHGQPLNVTESGFAPPVGSSASPQPLARAVSYAYTTLNGRSVLTRIDGPLPNGPAGTPGDSDVTLIDSDPRGNHTIAIHLPGDRISRFEERDAAGFPTVLATRDGSRLIRREYARTPRGELLAVTEHAWRLDAAGERLPASELTRSLRIARDARGNPTGATDPDGQALRFEYDNATRLTAVVGAGGDRRTVLHDTEGARVADFTLTAAGEHLDGLLRLRDENQLPLALIEQGRLNTLFGYDPAEPDRLLLTADALGHTTSQGTAPAGALIRRAADGGEIAIRHAPGAMLLRDEAQRLHARLYDDFGRVVAERDPDAGLTRYVWDTAGSLLRKEAHGRPTREEAEARITSFSYDTAGRLLERDSGPCREQLRHDGFLAIERHGCGEGETRQYDAFGRLVAHTQQLSAAVAFTTRYRYSPGGRLTARQLPDGQWLHYRNDADAGRLSQVARDSAFMRRVRNMLPDHLADRIDAWLPDAWTRSTLLDDVAYRPFGGRTGYTHGNGVTTRFDYEDGGRVTGVDTSAAGRPILSQRLRYDARGDLVEKVLADRSTGYRYDAVGRLATSTEPDALLQVRATTTASDVPSSQRWRYDPLGRPLSAPAASDAARMNRFGEDAGTAEREFAYDALGQLSHVRRHGQLVAEYRYDGRGRRIAKTVSGHTTHFIYDEQHRLAAEADPAGRITAQYLYLGHAPYARLQDDTVHAIHVDHLGTPLRMTDADGTVVWQGEQQPFGRLQRTTTQAHADTPELPLRLPGQYEDAETGLHYNVFRYYDPDAGRYLSPDPLGLADGTNRYAYVANRPVSAADPLGLFKIEGAFAVLDPLDDFWNLSPSPDQGHADIVYTAFTQYARTSGNTAFSATIIEWVVRNNYHTDAFPPSWGGTSGAGQLNPMNHWDNPNDGPMYADRNNLSPLASYADGVGDDWIGASLDQLNANRQSYQNYTTTAQGIDISRILSAFGQNTHMLGDFYAHTNWIDAPDRGGCVSNSALGGLYTERGYVPNGLDQRRTWNEGSDSIAADKLFTGTVALMNTYCPTPRGDIVCADDKTTHGYWAKDSGDEPGGAEKYSDTEVKEFREAGMYFWEVQSYAPEAPLGKPGNPVGDFGDTWYGDDGKTRADIRPGDRIYVRSDITTRYRMTYYLAVEHTKQEIARLERELAAVSVGGTSLSDIFRMDRQTLAARGIVYDGKISKQ